MANPRSFASLLGPWLESLDPENRSKFLVERRVEQILDQFQELVPTFILEHVNSIYLVKVEGMEEFEQEVMETPAGLRHVEPRKLIVYVDDSLVAAELNASRELIKLRYLERFVVRVVEFQINLSRGKYRERHPFEERLKRETQADVSRETPLDPEELAAIDEATAEIENPLLRDSFRHAMSATARFGKKSGKN
jgi:hypothetical protein